jgi:hypothetical protein
LNPFRRKTAPPDQQLPLHRQRLPDQDALIKLPERTRAGHQAKLARQRRVLRQALKGVGKCDGVFYGYQQTIDLMRYHLAAARRVGGDSGCKPIRAALLPAAV